MKSLEPGNHPAGIDERLKRSLDFPPDVATRVARDALRASGPSGRPGPARKRWLPAAAALALGLAAGFYLARNPVRPAPRRPSITNVGTVLIATNPQGKGRLLRSAGAPAPSGTLWIVRHGGTK
jgi:hypothetical protein